MLWFQRLYENNTKNTVKCHMKKMCVRILTFRNFVYIMCMVNVYGKSRVRRCASEIGICGICRSSPTGGENI